MLIGIPGLAGALVSASAALTVAVACGGTAVADPSQDDHFLALLNEKQIPPEDNVPGLIARAHGICGELDGGTSVQAIADEEANVMYGDNPALHLVPNRVNATAVRFISAAVDAYCPSHHGELPP